MTSNLPTAKKAFEPNTAEKEDDGIDFEADRQRFNTAFRDSACAFAIQSAIKEGKTEAECYGEHLLSRAFISSVCAKYQCSERYIGHDYDYHYGRRLLVRLHAPPRQKNEK